MRRRVLIVVLSVMLGLLMNPVFVYAEFYKWIDDQGTVHFTEEYSNIPEKYLPLVETRKTTTGSPLPGIVNKPPPEIATESSEPEGFEVTLSRGRGVWKTEGLLNGKVKQNFIFDTGASLTMISPTAAKELGIKIDENTPFGWMRTASAFKRVPLVTLESVKVSNAEAKNVEAVVSKMPSTKGDPFATDGLLGNSFFRNFRVVFDSLTGKLTLHAIKGEPSLDRPGGYDKDGWVAHFRYYNELLEDLIQAKTKLENLGRRDELISINNQIRYFENKLDELEREASFAGVPRDWRK